MTLIDTARATPPNETFAGAPSRTLRTQVWYPAVTAGADAPVDPAGAPYPLVVHAHALLDSRFGEEYLTEHLASHGYVVAAPDFPLSNIGAPGGATVDDLAGQPGDVRFLVAQLPGVLPGAIDEERVAASGLSFGALTILLAAYQGTPRLRAVLSMAPPYSCALTRRFFRAARPPLLILQGDADLMVPPRENGARVFRRARGERHLVSIRNGSHIGFVGFATGFDQAVHFDRFGCQVLLATVGSDTALPALPDERGITRAPAACPAPCTVEPVDPALAATRQHEIARVVATAFFDGYLKDDRGARCFLGSSLARENEELTVRSRRR